MNTWIVFMTVRNYLERAFFFGNSFNPFLMIEWFVLSLMQLALALFGSAHAAVLDVKLLATQFSPSSLVISVGDTVRWAGATSSLHNIKEVTSNTSWCAFLFHVISF